MVSHDWYDLEEEEVNYRKCKFKLKTGETCDKVISGSGKYCPEHIKAKCICCNAQPTHICQTLQVGEDKMCRATLCDNTFCTTDHNMRVHVNLTYQGGNK